MEKSVSRSLGLRRQSAAQEQGDKVSKTAIVGWVILIAGTALWIYGYFVTGHPPLFDWQAHTPWWIADYLPNVESEIGMVVVCVGSVLTYWPASQK